MKVLAINSSPKKGKGGTGLILTPFLEGLQEAGAEVELVYLHGLEIKPCLGDLGCWLKTPGQCIQKDDMQELLQKWNGADLVVLATPVYVDGMNGTMKMFLDRMIPAIQPFFEVKDEHCRHPRREGVKAGKVVVVSGCGFTELDNFDPLVAHVRAACKNMDREFAGAVLRPVVGALMDMHKRQPEQVADVFASLREAGRQLGSEGRMQEATLRTVRRELLPRDQYIEMANKSFRQAIAVFARRHKV